MKSNAKVKYFPKTQKGKFDATYALTLEIDKLKIENQKLSDTLVECNKQYDTLVGEIRNSRSINIEGEIYHCSFDDDTDRDFL